MLCLLHAGEGVVIWEEYSVTNTVLAGGKCSPTSSLLEDNGRDIFFTFLRILSADNALFSIHIMCSEDLAVVLSFTHTLVKDNERLSGNLANTDISLQLQPRKSIIKLSSLCFIST